MAGDNNANRTGRHRRIRRMPGNDLSFSRGAKPGGGEQLSTFMLHFRNTIRYFGHYHVYFRDVDAVLTWLTKRQFGEEKRNLHKYYALYIYIKYTFCSCTLTHMIDVEARMD